LPFATCVTIIAQDHGGGLQKVGLQKVGLQNKVGLQKVGAARSARSWRFASSPARGGSRAGTRPDRRMADADDALAVADADDAFAMHLGVMGSKLSFSERLKQARQLEALLEAFSDDPDDSGAPLLPSAQA